MTNLLSTRNVTAFAAAALSIGSITTAFAQTATPAAPAAAPTPRWTFSGLLDGYYQYSFNNPKSQNLPLIYHQNQDAPTLTLGQLDANYATPATGGFGAHITAITGDTANADAVGNESRFKSVMQAYVTEITAKGYGVDFGKFYTPFGYEADNDSNLNMNYSFSDVYTDLLPVYNAGFRFYTPTIFNGWVLKGYVVNALNDTSDEGVSDDNSNKGLFFVGAYTDPKGKYSFTENWGFSSDKNVAFGTLDGNGVGDSDGVSTDFGNTDDTTLSDTDLTLTPTAKLTLGGEFVYRQDAGVNKVFTPGFVDTLVARPAVAGDILNYNRDNQVSRGYALYAQYNNSTLTDWAFRYSYVDFKFDGRPYDLTATYAIHSKDSKWLTKLEYRYDGIYKPAQFEDGGGNFDKSNMSTLTVGEVYTF